MRISYNKLKELAEEDRVYVFEDGKLRTLSRDDLVYNLISYGAPQFLLLTKLYLKYDLSNHLTSNHFVSSLIPQEGINKEIITVLDDPITEIVGF